MAYPVIVKKKSPKANAPANRQDRLNCKRKTPYKTAEAAADIIEILRADGKIYSPFASPYKCKVCGWYHWGNKYAP